MAVSWVPGNLSSALPVHSPQLASRRKRCFSLHCRLGPAAGKRIAQTTRACRLGLRYPQSCSLSTAQVAAGCRAQDVWPRAVRKRCEPPVRHKLSHIMSTASSTTAPQANKHCNATARCGVRGCSADEALPFSYDGDDEMMMTLLMAMATMMSRLSAAASTMEIMMAAPRKPTSTAAVSGVAPSWSHRLGAD